MPPAQEVTCSEEDSVRPHGSTVSVAILSVLTCWPGSSLLPPRPSPKAPPVPLTRPQARNHRLSLCVLWAYWPHFGTFLLLERFSHCHPCFIKPPSSLGPGPTFHPQLAFRKNLGSNLCSVLYQMHVNEPFRDSGPGSPLSPPTLPAALSRRVLSFSLPFPPPWGRMVSVL